MRLGPGDTFEIAFINNVVAKEDRTRSAMVEAPCIQACRSNRCYLQQRPAGGENMTEKSVVSSLCVIALLDLCADTDRAKCVLPGTT